MSRSYQFIPSLAEEMEVPADGILTRTLHDDEQLKIVLFGFSASQELSEHTSSLPAIMHFLSGVADVSLGSDCTSAQAGTWIHMTPQTPHRIVALEPTMMLLTLVKS